MSWVVRVTSTGDRHTVDEYWEFPGRVSTPDARGLSRPVKGSQYVRRKDSVLRFRRRFWSGGRVEGYTVQQGPVTGGEGGDGTPVTQHLFGLLCSRGVCRE